MKKLLIATVVMLSACSPAPTVVLRIDCGEYNNKDLQVTINNEVAGTCPLDTMIRHGETVISARKDNEDASYLYSEVTEKVAENAMKRIELEFKTIYPELYHYKKATDISGINRYLAEFPEGKNAPKLREKLENIYYENAKNVEGIESYLAKFPSGKYASEAHEKLEIIFYSKAKDFEGINKYLEKFPNGKNSTELQEKLENIFYTRATDIKGAETYLEKYPTGKNTTEVKQKLAQAKEKLRKEMLAAGFIDNNDGTVTQTSSGLQWMRCSLGQQWTGSTCAGEAMEMNWNDALRTAMSYSYAGHSDWRVPTVDELDTLVQCPAGRRPSPRPPERWARYTDGTCHGNELDNPKININAFPSTPADWFWSSSPDTDRSGDAWGVHFGGGNVGYYGKYGLDRVRLVRAGQ